ncbi:MAG TPA: hypothetical protein DCE25_11945, partial [Pseudomonas sp.]|nr:hypothetical protein [Pseudomonas sp.]
MAILDGQIQRKVWVTLATPGTLTAPIAGAVKAVQVQSMAQPALGFLAARGFFAALGFTPG